MLRDSVTEMLHFQASLLLSETQDSACWQFFQQSYICQVWQQMQKIM